MKKVTFLLAALLLTCGLSWAQTTDVLTHDLIGVEGTTYSTWSDITSNSDAVYAGNTAGGNDAIQMRSNNNNSGIVTTVSGGVVTNIAVVWNTSTTASRTLNIYGSNSAYSAATDLYGNNAGELLGTIVYGTSTELAISGEYAFIGIRSNSGALWLDEISITWGQGSGVTPPSITASDVEIAYNATSGAVEYTINNPVSGGVLSATTTDEWLTLGTVGGTVPFTCTVNEAGAPREGVITLTYTYGEQSINKSVTVTQAGNPNAVNNISDITANGPYSVQGTIVAKSQRGFIVGDGTGYVYYYNVNYDQTAYAIGDMVKIAGSIVTYGGVFEFNNTATVTAATSSNYVAENPTVITGEEMDARVASTSPAQLSSYVQYEGLLSVNGTYYNITNIAGATTAKGSISYPLDTEFAELDGKQVRVSGYYVGVSSSQYYNTMLGTIEEVEITEPIITVNPATVNAPSDGAEGTLNVTYLGFADDIMPEVAFCNAEGAAATYDWIEADMDGNNNVEYIIYANQGEARTAYLKVVINDVYSNLVTINQAEYVTPALDYATLPFEFNGGKAEIESTDGLTQEGLGSDYNATNNPTTKLKFDGTGDWLILHFLEAPGTLTFDIKGNGFSGGTFTVQTSEDGETYTDLVTYTELGATQNEQFSNLSENVRYIKWIYTEKGQGNVGLGNIVLYEYGNGPTPEASITVNPATVDVNAEQNNGTLTVTYENITTINAEVYFCDAEGAAASYNWITANINADNNVAYSVTANEGAARTAYFKVYVGETYSNLVTVNQAAYVAPFEPATYTLATTIESGKTYIIVGSKTIDDVTTYYAMGEQRNNNRGGYEITVDGTTATVGTADVHEFVITALEENGFYSIYDNGYLYAAGSDKNYLRTLDSLDVNGEWEISIDSVFSIVASNSENRNVMQFNYNGGNPIFSCYSSASQSPVYLYVKDEESTTVTETIALAAGSNWISANVEITLDDLKAALVAALPGTQITIYSQGNGNTTYNGSRWRGQLTTMDVTQMYMVSVTSGCEISLTGAPVVPAEHPITIHTGTNWIAFPLSQSMTLTNAFAGFAINGDMAISQSDGSSTYNNRWRGVLTTLQPGKGYMYKSAATGDKTLVFPTNAK